MLRTGNRKLAAATLLLDMLKGTAAALLGALAGPLFAMLAGFGAFVGIFTRFGSTSRAAKASQPISVSCLALFWQGAVIFAAIWIAMAYLFRYSSLSALIAAALTPVTLYFLGFGQLAMLFSIMSIIVIIKHRANIERLLAGTESRLVPSEYGSALAASVRSHWLQWHFRIVRNSTD